MRKTSILFGGLGVGAGLMYLFDSHSGARRRARIKDQFAHARRLGRDAAHKAGRDLENRTRGTLEATRSLLHHDEEGPDQVLEARVRSKLGRLLSHPRAIEVTVANGCVTLSGPILADDVAHVLLAVERIDGVRTVVDWLDAHESAEDMPELQGDERMSGSRIDVFQENWAPATRLLVGTGGAWLIARALVRRSPLCLPLAAVGAGLLARSITNRPFASLAGVEGRTRTATVDVHKTILVHAPVEQVYRLWSHLENFPYFMEHVSEVQPTGDGLYHWTATGPAGTEVGWDAMVTDHEEGRRLSWKSLPGSTVANEGTVRFEPADGDLTRIDIQVSYTPPGGLAGHTIAKLFGKDPKTAMDEDLVRFKSLIEHGKTTVKGHEVRLEELTAR